MTVREQAIRLAGCFVGALAVLVVWKLGRGASSLVEADAMRARKDPRRRVQKPEWLRRWERKMARLQGMG